MYEDAAIELGAFRPGGRVFSIASAGCTAMKLAARHDVVALDINPVQLAYVGRRLAGGPIQRGTAERLLKVARALRPLVGWYRWRVREFLELCDPAEQIAYWRRLDTRRFRAALYLLFSLPTLRAMYSGALLESLPANFGVIIRKRMERGFSRHPNRTNPYARALLLDKRQPDDETIFERNAPGSGEIQLVCADAASYLELQPAGSFDGFALSNILDGANTDYRQRLFAAVKRAAAADAVAVMRSFREPPAAIPTNRAAEDRAMLWGIVDVRPAATL
jgi:S-adenosylmethionine:diacylglycerol 3-amino-3-carboxypropyl transferase